MLRKIAVISALALAALVGAAAPATADIRIGTQVSGSAGACADTSASNGHVTVCYQADGDYLYVKDGDSDGRSAYGYFTWPGDRDTCRNPYGYGTWVRCNYDLPEGMRIMYQGYTQDNGGLFDPKHDWTSEANEWS
jgi:hypothetical protein